ncbi:c-type cytochrome biogenesis protein CcmI [Oceanibium sediminis]|uniref:c-type cytochrome biogenesis protein CcmI n=1 Tax=Oceanibium sediminis TaxID=2026339 RepID=UPI000DD4522A|nr:c-type cytochrome biogenesis protein CcmI [Oceanibium sediminis]
MLFWAIALLISLLTAGVLLRGLVRNTPAAEAGDTSVSVYKDQLAEVESDLARGVLSESEADSLRTEVSRRLIAAADAAAAAPRPAPTGANRAMALLVALLVLGGGLALYAFLGAPGARDMPLDQRLAENAARYAARPPQAEVRAMLVENGTVQNAPVPEEQAALLEQLRDVLATRQDDLTGHRLLADTLARLGQWPEAAEAQADVLRILGADATGRDHADLAEFLIFAVNGYVSPEAEQALVTTLEKDPRNPRGRYYSGLGAMQAGRIDITYDLWTRLLAEGPANAPWVQAIRGQIADVALAAGRPVPEAAAPSAGPSAEDIANAADLAPEDRDAMVRSMVARLSDRLATEGGPASDWARLIRAYGVLGQRADASRIWNEAAEVFADSPADLSILRQAARDAEVVQ